jgi:hypothetical protein
MSTTLVVAIVILVVVLVVAATAIRVGSWCSGSVAFAALADRGWC